MPIRPLTSHAGAIRRSAPLFALVAACSSAHGGVSPTPAQACADLASARCARLEACAPATLEHDYGDTSTCQMRQPLACNESLAATGTSATPSAFDACAQAIPGESCADYLVNNPSAACTPSPGTLAQGAACLASAQCASTYCAVAHNAVCGTCQPIPVAGDSCATTGCGRDIICLATTLICATPVVDGGACNRAMPCEPGSSCVGATMTTTGTCQPEVATAGASCDPMRQTAPDCNRLLGLYCDRTSRICAAVAWATGGQPCGLVGATEVRCSAGGLCVTAAGATSGTCVAPAVDGAACDSTSGPPCLLPAQCVPTVAGGTAGVCTLPNASTCR